MKFDEIKNTSERIFKNISSEAYRTYIYPGFVGNFVKDGKPQLVNTITQTIFNPIGLSVSKSGHYVIDTNGVTHFFPFGFVELNWIAKENQPNIVI